ncbi:hypothetical protein ACFSCZ_15775 [Siminovitchia sediminis]|uniref:DUF5673 domain-containing protein n=1 Tax=Siminovitchia sediminis TaxID=1274353 RepID=A0ABW4KJ41_9BACI
MKLWMDLIFLCVLGYFFYRFIQVLIKMKQKVILPASTEELAMIRRHPEKPVEVPTYSKQKAGIILSVIMLIFVAGMFIAGVFVQPFNWSFYLLVFLPLTYSHDLLNMFAIIPDGLLCGSRFISWKDIKSYEFVPIDRNHKYYGYSRAVNDGYELKLKTRGFPVSCMITTDEMKENLADVLNKHKTQQVNRNSEQSL